jgi:hypothetical protein
MTLASDLKKASFTIAKCNKCGFFTYKVDEETFCGENCGGKYENVLAIFHPALKKICEKYSIQWTDTKTYASLKSLVDALSELEQEEGK